MELQLFSEKQFAPSQRRLRQAREKGQVPHSTELSAALALLATTQLLTALAPSGIARLNTMLHGFWGQAPPADFRSGVSGLFYRWVLAFALVAGPLLLGAVAVGAGTGMLQSGFLFTPRLAAPDLGRLNPGAAFARIFSGRTAFDLLKRTFKLVLVGWLGYGAIRDLLPRLPALAAMPVTNAAATLGNTAAGLLQRLAYTLLAIGMADYGYQFWQHMQQLRMTRADMKQEMKQQESSPELRQRVKKRQREIAGRRMMQQVPKASVVVTNPTHFAVALRYDPAMPAPRVVAKGQDLVALRIRRIAQQSSVPVVENPPLARALHAQVALDAEIPPELYQAVAELMGYVYRTRRRPRPTPSPRQE